MSLADEKAEIYAQLYAQISKRYEACPFLLRRSSSATIQDSSRLASARRSALAMACSSS